jgi:hypothetical protein
MLLVSSSSSALVHPRYNSPTSSNLGYMKANDLFSEMLENDLGTIFELDDECGAWHQLAGCPVVAEHLIAVVKSQWKHFFLCIESNPMSFLRKSSME